jgi:hypothetical protein
LNFKVVWGISEAFNRQKVGRSLAVVVRSLKALWCYNYAIIIESFGGFPRQFAALLRQQL